MQLIKFTYLAKQRLELAKFTLLLGLDMIIILA